MASRGRIQYNVIWLFKVRTQSSLTHTPAEPKYSEELAYVYNSVLTIHLLIRCLKSSKDQASLLDVAGFGCPPPATVRTCIGLPVSLGITSAFYIKYGRELTWRRHHPFRVRIAESDPHRTWFDLPFISGEVSSVCRSRLDLVRLE
jgi:hypothetical protein